MPIFTALRRELGAVANGHANAWLPGLALLRRSLSEARLRFTVSNLLAHR
jgi:hypothetical protein